MNNEFAGGVSEKLVHLTREIKMLRQELLVQGELLEGERLDRKAEVDRLKIEISTLKKLLSRFQPDFMTQFEKLYREERNKFDPELEKSAG